MSSKIKSKKNNLLIGRSNFESILLLSPIFLIVTVLPLIVKMKTYDPRLSTYDWFSAQEEFNDFFLYYKQWFFVGICWLIFLIIVTRAFIDKKLLKFNKTFIPLLLYTITAILSTLLSEYRSFGFSGSFEQFENLFCLIGYGLVVYYIYLIIQSEAEQKLVITSVALGALCVGIVGTCQAFGLDYINSQYLRQLIGVESTNIDPLRTVFGEGRVYATLFNPNYVGVYTATMIPLFTTMLFFSKHIKEYVLYTLVVVTSAISMFGSQSKAGIISIVVALLIAIIFLRKIILRKKIIALALISLLAIGFVTINHINNNAYVNAIVNIFKSDSKSNIRLTSINTSDQNISIEYAGNTMYAELFNDGTFVLYDDNHITIPYYIAVTQEGSNFLQIDDLRFTDIVPILSNNATELTFYIEGRYFTFISKEISGEYLYYNRYGKFSPLRTIDSGLFKNHEALATNRGFIWGRTIPLLKDNILLGSGADSFMFAYPQYDYVNFINYGFESTLITKPHSFYLQTSVQTGFLSLLSLLVFFGIYLIQSFKLYYHNNFLTLSSKIGLSIFISISSYLISCLTNDSNITVAPTFWVLLGIGLVANLQEKACKN